MPLPQQTPEERARALQQAQEARSLRSQVKKDIAAGRTTLEAVIFKGQRGATDELGDHARIIGRIRISQLVKAVNGIGPKRAAEILTIAGISKDLRIDQLSQDQIDAVVAAVGDR